MNYTTIEQSKKLLELGLNPETADMFWQSNLNGSDRQYLLDLGEEEYFDIEINFEHCSIGDYDIPAWSLGALLELMPKIKEDDDDGGCYPILCKGYNTDKWHCVYRSSIHITDWYESSIDAAFEMVVWLIENGYIKTEQK